MEKREEEGEPQEKKTDVDSLRQVIKVNEDESAEKKEETETKVICKD